MSFLLPNESRSAINTLCWQRLRLRLTLISLEGGAAAFCGSLDKTIPQQKVCGSYLKCALKGVNARWPTSPNASRCENSD